MPNDVYRAIDAVLVLSVDDKTAAEGKAADALVSQYGLSNTVGRLRNVTIVVTSDLRPYYELGGRYPTHLRPGIIQTSGTIERAHINGALLRLLLGDGAKSPPAAGFVQPAFNIISTLRNTAIPTQQTRVIVSERASQVGTTTSRQTTL